MCRWCHGGRGNTIVDPGAKLRLRQFWNWIYLLCDCFYSFEITCVHLRLFLCWDCYSCSFFSLRMVRIHRFKPEIRLNVCGKSVSVSPKIWVLSGLHALPKVEDSGAHLSNRMGCSGCECGAVVPQVVFPRLFGPIISSHPFVKLRNQFVSSSKVTSAIWHNGQWDPRFLSSRVSKVQGQQLLGSIGASCTVCFCLER